MKLNYNVTLTLILLTLMLGAGYMSSRLGFAVGHEAIEGVSQPDARPTSKIKNRKAASTQQGALVLLKEEDILNTVKARIEGKGKNAKPEKPQPQNKALAQEKPAQKPQVAKKVVYQPGFPITSRNQKVTLDVVSTDYSGGALLIKVNLKNEGDRNVRFLYSFLDVTDDQGRALSANTEGLPTELTANGKTFSGTMSIPTALLNDVNKLSMTLTDYPDQKLRLQVSNIPVKK